MMLLGLIPFVVSLALAPAAPALSRCLAPRLAAPLLTLLALATALATGIVLCLAAFAAVARLPLAARLGRWTPQPLQAGQPGTGWGFLAGAAALTLLAAAACFAAGEVRDLTRAVRACRALAAGQLAGGAAEAGAAETGAARAGGRPRIRARSADRLVITADERPVAYAVPFPAGTIVVSAGLLGLLGADERRALLAHEHAHLRQHHAGYVLLAGLAARANPLLRPLARQVRLATELAADEQAAQEVGDRRVVACALARASLAARTSTAAPAAGRTILAATGGRLAIADTDAAARVRALLAPPRRRRPWAAATALALTLASAATAITLTLATHQQFEVAQSAWAQAHPAPAATAGRGAAPAAGLAPALHEQIPLA